MFSLLPVFNVVNFWLLVRLAIVRVHGISKPFDNQNLFSYCSLAKLPPIRGFRFIEEQLGAVGIVSSKVLFSFSHWRTSILFELYLRLFEFVHNNNSFVRVKKMSWNNLSFNLYVHCGSFVVGKCFGSVILSLSCSGICLLLFMDLLFFRNCRDV